MVFNHHFSPRGRFRDPLSLLRVSIGQRNAPGGLVDERNSLAGW